MTDSAGRLNQVDPERAQAQWNNLKSLFEQLGCAVEVLPGAPGFPDMVFCANQTFPFVDSDGRPSIILSRMHSPQRQGEVAHFAAWARRRGWPAEAVTDFDFEGCGDALWNYDSGTIFAGFGFRTDSRVYDWLQAKVHRPVVKLELVDERFYHLDTCLVILTGDTAAYVAEAFTADGLKTLRAHFHRLIRIELEEALTCFAGNAFTPNGRDVILHPGAKKFVKELRESGFHTYEADTSEFLKSGGSVFCMKQVLF